MNFQEQSQVFLAGRHHEIRIRSSHRHLWLIRGAPLNHILPAIGPVDLAAFGNGAMKEFAGSLTRKGLSPKTVLETTILVKLIVASAVTLDGDYLYPRSWNQEFIDLPPVKDQKQPILTPEQLKAALADKHYGLFYALLAGTGLRIGEALALRFGTLGKKTGWSPVSGLVDVRTSFWRNQEGLPKTQAGTRQIDLYSDLNVRLEEYVRYLGLSPTDHDFVFMGSAGTRLCETTIRKDSLKSLGIEGFHSFRRYRLTHLRSQGVPEDLIQYWMGHAKVGVTDRYSKMSENVGLRKEWVAKAGLGFEL